MLYIAVYGLLWFGIIIIILANGVEQENERERMSMLIAQRESRWIKYLQEKHVHSNRSVCESAKSSSFQSIKAISFQRFFFSFFCFCPRKYGVIVEHRFCHSTIALSMSVTKNQNHRENRSSILIWNDVDHSLWM